MLRLPRRLLPFVAALSLASCLSPTLPLPPPDRPSVSAPDENGLVRLQGVAAPKAEVFAWNRATNLIAGEVTGDDSLYDFKIQGHADDFIELWYVQGSDQSPTVRFRVPAK